MVKEKKYMVKFKNMKQFVKIFISLFSLFMFSQNIKSEKNDFLITISKKTLILNKEQYTNELNNLQNLFYNQELNSDKYDSIQKVKLTEMNNEINLNFEQVIGEIKSEEISKAKFFQHKIESNLIQYFAYDSIVTRDYEIINLKSGSLKVFATDSTTVLNDFKEYPFYDSKIINIKVNKNIKKTILGFDCFQVIVDYYEFNDFREESQDYDFEKFMSKYPNQMTLWVTNEIKLNYHPIVKFKSILEKFYPIQVEIVGGISKSSVDIFTMESIKFLK